MTALRIFTALLLTLVVATPALAQDRRVPSSGAELRLSYAPIVQRVQPAVVNVYAAKTVQNRNPLLDDPMFRRFFGVPGQQPEQMQRSLGSGVMVDASGLVVTNNHVIEGADQVKVSLADKREFEAEIVLKDSRTDLAVLRLKDTKDKFATLDFANSDELLVGDVVLAIGNPFGVGQTVTHGIISALARTQVGITDYQFFIQTDAAINPGNSGGPLVNIRGEVIGINSAIASQTGFYSGYGFAIPITLAKTVMDDIITHGRVRRAIMGISLQEVTAEDAQVNNLKDIAGAKVVNFGAIPDGPGEKAGIEPGDIITKADGRVIDRVSTLQRVVRMHQPGETVELEAVRYGKRQSFKVKLIEAKAEEKAIAANTAAEKPEVDAGATATGKKLGVTLESITAAVRTAAILSDDVTGVVIKSIDPAGPAASKLIIEDVITGVIFPEKADVRTMADLQRALAKLKDGDIVGLKLSRRVDQKGTRQPSIVNLRIGG
jgi:Do/DeqQ family serine protease